MRLNDSLDGLKMSQIGKRWFESPKGWLQVTVLSLAMIPQYLWLLCKPMPTWKRVKEQSLCLLLLKNSSCYGEMKVSGLKELYISGTLLHLLGKVPHHIYQLSLVFSNSDVAIQPGKLQGHENTINEMTVILVKLLLHRLVCRFLFPRMLHIKGCFKFENASSHISE